MTDAPAMAAPSRSARVRPETFAGVRLDQVQLMRGLACLLLVLFHVVGGSVRDGLQVADDTWLRKILDFLLYIRMPIFGFLSGYVYALKPMARGQAKPFLKGKARRLVLPLAAVSTLFFVVWNSWYGDLGAALPRMWRIYVFSYEIYWFLQAMVLIFLVVAVLETLGLLKNLWSAALVGLCAFLAGYPLETVTFMSLGGALYLLPYFLIGLGARRFALTGDRRVLAMVGAVLAAALVIHAWRVLNLPHDQSVGRVTVLSLLIGGCGSLLLMRFIAPVPLLARIGDSSFAIFLFHIFFVTASRVVLARLGDPPLAIYIACGLAAGLAGPMLVEVVLRRNAIGRRVFLGLR